LWALGRRMTGEGIDNPFTGLRRAMEYRNLSMAETALEELGKIIRRDGIPKELHPLVIGFAGYGNVSKGAQRILEFLPVIEVTPEELLRDGNDIFISNKNVYKVVFKEERTVELIDKSVPGYPFDLQDYFNHPEKYTGVFSKYVPHLTILMNCIYWSAKYPRLITKDLIHSMYSGKKAKLKVIGDISVDVEGAVEVTLKTTDSGNPVFVYDVDKKAAIDGVTGNGPVILAVDNLPAELPRESSAKFSNTLMPFIPELVEADFSVEFDDLDLIAPLKRAIICYHGKLTPSFEYLNEYLNF
jgi:saccharopine dehydrogenase (NAD+, L-lysine forming)